MRYSDHRREEATFSLDVASSNVSPSSDAQNEQTQLSHPALILRSRLTAGQQVLILLIVVRIHAPQPKFGWTVKLESHNRL